MFTDRHVGQRAQLSRFDDDLGGAPGSHPFRHERIGGPRLRLAGNGCDFAQGNAYLLEIGPPGPSPAKSSELQDESVAGTVDFALCFLSPGGKFLNGEANARPIRPLSWRGRINRRWLLQEAVL